MGYPRAVRSADVKCLISRKLPFSVSDPSVGFAATGQQMEVGDQDFLCLQPLFVAQQQGFSCMLCPKRERWKEPGIRSSWTDSGVGMPHPLRLHGYQGFCSAGGCSFKMIGSSLALAKGLQPDFSLHNAHLQVVVPTNPEG